MWFLLIQVGDVPTVVLASYPNPFAATSTAEVDPFAATSDYKSS